MPRLPGPGKLEAIRGDDGKVAYHRFTYYVKCRRRIVRLPPQKNEAVRISRRLIEERDKIHARLEAGPDEKEREAHRKREDDEAEARRTIRLSELVAIYDQAELVRKSAGHAKEWRAYYGRWTEALEDPIVSQIKRREVRAIRDQYRGGMDLGSPAQLNGNRGTRRGRGKPRSPTTANRAVAALQACFNWGVSEEWIDANPIHGLKRLPENEATAAKVRAWLRDEEVERLLAAAAKEDEDRSAGFTSRGIMSPLFPQQPLLAALISTGMRIGEAATLTWDDIDHVGRVITVRAVNAKSSRSRTVPFPPTLLPYLKEAKDAAARLLGRAASGADLVFLSPKGKAIDRANARKVLYAALERAGIEQYREDGTSIDVHALRTTYGCRMALIGTPPQHLQKLMGHADIETTMAHYVRFSAADVRGSVDQAGLLPKAEEPEDRGRAGGHEPASGIVVVSLSSWPRGLETQPKWPARAKCCGARA